ncbi:cytochrome b/b6 domain-containing protein [Shewanella colwelliana]|uniref:cytochrome b/b6 domain-containing protein n=1 Tax=Shewanella colwelliana TaxID=23 RepID=UPI003734F531
MLANNSTPVRKIKVKVWDLPTRVFHWTMIVLLGALWWTAENGEMGWHQVFAYSLMVLIVFRLVWGFIGSDTSRFSHFVKPPGYVMAYVKQPKHISIGHNPIGGYMVVTMIAVLLFQLVSGLFATDDIFTEGPLYRFVSSDVSSTLTSLHKSNFNILLGLVVLHVLAVIVHGLKGDKLVGAMITGYKSVTHEVKGEVKFRSNVIALILVCVLAGVTANFLILPLTAML